MFFEHLLHAKSWMLNSHIEAMNMTLIHKEIRRSHGTQFVNILYKNKTKRYNWKKKCGVTSQFLGHSLQKNSVPQIFIFQEENFWIG